MLEFMEHGKAAYEAYRQSRAKEADDSLLPAWADLPTPIKWAWMCAGGAAVRVYHEELTDNLMRKGLIEWDGRK